MTPAGGAVVEPTPEAKTAAPPISAGTKASRPEPLFGILGFPWLALVGRDVRAGVAAAVVTLPISLSAGLLAISSACGFC
jgi:hypothetical protein